MRCGIHQGFFLSLINYISFINGMITEIEASGLCCDVQGIPSTPPGYADDVATACLSKIKMDRVLDLVDQYGKKWRFKFNAKKSAILVYGENKKSNLSNAKFRTFKLGNDKVPEKQTYDHVGFKARIYSDDDSRVNEKITKARRALNACAGVGIRKNGLTMITCNIIYWSIVIPILTFGSEIWCVSETDYENLMSFQTYAGKRVQRFPPRSPNCSGFFGLGWIRITTYILVKKLLFALSILRLDDQSLIRRVFIERSKTFMENRPQGKDNIFESPTFAILNTAKRLGVLSTLCDMMSGRTPLKSKSKWSNLVWDKAWEVEDLFWESTRVLYKNNDLLYKTLSCTRYSPWWDLSDKFPYMIRICENMAKLVSHSSMLKGDDIRLKGLPQSVKNCQACDMYIIESLQHLVMQCPEFEDERVKMSEEIYKIDDRLKITFEEKPSEVFYWYIGKRIDGQSYELMQERFLVESSQIYVRKYIETELA